MHKKIKKYIGPALFMGLVFFMLARTGYAQDSLGGDWDQYLRGALPGFNGVSENTTGQDLAINLVRRGIGILKFVIGAVALILGVIFAIQLIFSQGKEENITKAKQNFLWLFVGFAILMIADNIADIFNPETATSEALIDFNAGQDQLRQIANYIKWLFGSIIILLMTVSGFRMIMAGGKEEVLTKEKTHLAWSGIGMLVILLASNIVNAIYVVNAPDDIQAGETGDVITQVIGLIRLALVFLGPIVIAFTIFAGFMFLTSFNNEDQANKAKRMIIAGITGIVIIYAAFAIVNTFAGANLTSGT